MPSIEASSAMTAQPQPDMVQDTIERPTVGTVQVIPQHDFPLAQPLLEPSGPSGGKRSFSKISTTAMAVKSGENISGPYSRPVKSAPVISSRAASYHSSDAQGSPHLTALRLELGRPQTDPPFTEGERRGVRESFEPYEDEDAEPKPAPKKRKKVHTSPYIVTSASPSPELSPLHTDAVVEETDSHSREVPVPVETQVKVKRVGSTSKAKIETSQKRSSVRSKTRSRPDWHIEVFTPLEQEKQKSHGMLSDHNTVKERSRAAERKRAGQERAEKERALEEQNEERDD